MGKQPLDTGRQRDIKYLVIATVRLRRRGVLVISVSTWRRRTSRWRPVVIILLRWTVGMMFN